MNGFHHLRQRITHGRHPEPFPSKIGWKRDLAYFMYGIGLFAPLALLPQILQIYRTHDAQGLSLTTFALISVVHALWAVYGAVHKEKHLVIANAAMFAFNAFIVAGILLY